MLLQKRGKKYCKLWYPAIKKVFLGLNFPSRVDWIGPRFYWRDQRDLKNFNVPPKNKKGRNLQRSFSSWRSKWNVGTWFPLWKVFSRMQIWFGNEILIHISLKLENRKVSAFKLGVSAWEMSSLYEGNPF